MASKKTEGTPPEPGLIEEEQVKETPEVEKGKEGTPSAIPEQYQGKTHNFQLLMGRDTTRMADIQVISNSRIINIPRDTIL